MSPDYVLDSLFKIFDYLKPEREQNFSLNKNFYKNEKTSILKVVIPPKGGGESVFYKILIRRLHKKGYSCLSYYIPSSILSSDVNETLKLFDSVKDQIRLDISKIKVEHKFERIDIIASSLGVVSASLVSNNNDDIDNLFFLVPGNCLASSLWNGIRTQDLTNTYEKQNINEEQLKNIWKDLAPENNIDKLKDKKIFISISKSDKVIPYIYGKKLVDTIKKLYPNNLVIKENHYLGHYLTVAKYYLFSKELLK